MEFTTTFLKLLFWSLYLVGPLLLFLGALVIVLGQIVRKMEGWDVFNGIYWSIITATTVGYGDIRPLKKRSKVISILIAFIGIVLTGIIIAVALNSASLALERHADEHIILKLKSIDVGE